MLEKSADNFGEKKSGPCFSTTAQGDAYLESAIEIIVSPQLFAFHI